MAEKAEKKEGRVAPWINPQAFQAETQGKKLMLYNSLTKTKEEFFPREDGRIGWYICGPTTYDSSHLGHARNYVGFDIVRRVLEKYFNYDVFYVMNITDIDDKIIIKTHQAHLKESIAMAKTFVDANADAPAALKEALEKAVELGATKDIKLIMAAVDALIAAQAGTSLNIVEANVQEEYIKIARKYEVEFLEDMRTLGVYDPDVLTRVSEYCPPIVEYIEKLEANGYAYESQGSVYFDTKKFGADGHFYGKLQPNAVNTDDSDSAGLLAEGEGSLSAELGSKRSPGDFALWKSSKRGEPKWPSKWSDGRPGWHIECSAMASALLGENVDINAGGEDLRFPHHDNQLAQSEGYFGCKQWVNYFLHSGHLSISGLKMSKSLKNFITIRQAMSPPYNYTPAQLRMLFLQNRFDSPMEYSDETMKAAVAQDKLFSEFFLQVKAFLRVDPVAAVSAQNWRPQDLELYKKLQETKSKVRDALLDSIDTPRALLAMSQLVGKTNTYLGIEGDANSRLFVVKAVASYLTHMLTIFGVIDVSSNVGPSVAGDVDKAMAPVLDCFARFRDDVRTRARAAKPVDGELLTACDDVRDNQLPPLGVRLEDRPDGHSVWKLVDAQELMQERERKIEEKRLRDEEKRAKDAEKKAKQLARDRVPPNELFLKVNDALFDRKPIAYTELDERGIPTFVEGEKKGDQPAEPKPIKPAFRKTLEKAWAAQEAAHQKYLAAQSAEGCN